MEKSDLKTGMKVRYRNGDERIVQRGLSINGKVYDLTLAELGGYGWSMDIFNGDMTCSSVDSKGLDIVEVFESEDIRGLLSLNNENWVSKWTRPEPKKCECCPTDKPKLATEIAMVANIPYNVCLDCKLCINRNLGRFKVMGINL